MTEVREAGATEVERFGAWVLCSARYPRRSAGMTEVGRGNDGSVGAGMTEVGGGYAGTTE